MRHAPPVGAACSGGLRWQFVRTALAMAAAGAGAAWGLQQAGQAALLALLPMAAAATVTWRATRPRPVQLQWDGSAWRADGHAGRPALMLDAGGLMLLRWQPEAGRAGWIAVCRDEAGRAWPALRAALYSPAASARPDPSDA